MSLVGFEPTRRSHIASGTQVFRTSPSTEAESCCDIGKQPPKKDVPKDRVQLSVAIAGLDARDRVGW